MPAVWFRKVALSGAATLLLFGCGGDDDEAQVDAGSGGGDSGACPVADSLGPFDPLDPAAAFHFTQQMDPSVRLLSVGSDISDASADLLLIQLYDNFGEFAGGQIRTGTFSIEGDEVAVQSCGICIRLLADVQEDAEGNPTVTKEYIAIGGSVTVDSIGTRTGNEIAGAYSGQATGLVFGEVDPDDKLGGALAGGCETEIERVTWDETIANGDDEE